MLIIGDNDLVVPKESSINSFNTISTASKDILTYPKSAHNAFLEHPEKMEQDIINFITR